jgi:PAS domain S-box-containing protein
MTRGSPHGDVAPETVRILHVDDDPEFLVVATVLLEREDERFYIETATIAADGLDQLAAGTFDCIISDYDMPDKNGIQFLDTIRDDYPEVPFILFTGKGSEEIASDAISAGVTDYLQKDTGTDQYELLANRILNAVVGYQSRRLAEKRARRSETLISNLPGMVYRCRNEPGWPMETVEGDVEALTGYTATELEASDGIWGEEVLHPDDREPIWDAVQEGLAEDGTFEITYRIVTNDGRTKWVWEQGRAICDDEGERDALEGFVTDISDRKEAERALRDTKERYEQILEHLSDYVVILNETGEISYVSPAVERVTGYEPEDVIGTNAFEYVHPDDQPVAADAFAEMLQSADQEVSVEYRTKTSDGSYRWVEVRGGNYLDDPIIEGVMVSVRDITEYKERERELEQSRERHRSLFEHSAAVIFEEDFSAYKRYVDELNAEVDDLETYFENNPDEIGTLLGEVEILNVTSEAVEYYEAASREDLIENLEEWFTQEAYEANEEIGLRIANGETRFRVTSVTEVPSGERKHEVIDVAVPDSASDDFSRVYLTVTEITDQVEHRRQLTKLHERTGDLMQPSTKEATARVAVEAARDIIDAPLNGVHLLNDAGDTLLGSVGTDQVTELMDELPAYEQNAAEGTSDAFVWSVFEEGQPLYIEDTRTLDPLEADPPARTVLVIPLGDHGIFIASAREQDAFDKTDRGLMNTLATSLTAALDRVDRERELQRERDRLDAFAGVVSHDLRNPLTVARGHLELAREECETPRHETIETALERMDRIIEDVLWLAREGRDIRDTEPVSLGDAIEAAWAMVGEQADDATLRLAEGGHQLPTVVADYDRLCQLLENVLRNGIDHGDDGVTVTVGSLADGFYIEDDGPGISEEHGEGIFKAGYSTAQAGTGLGLNIVKQVADAHGWDIHVTHGSDGGARFEITGVEFDA